MNPDREQAYELVASQPEISLDAATVREIVEKYNCDDSPHFLATVHLAERVIQLERDNTAQAEALREAREFIVLVSCDEGLTYENLINKIDAALKVK